MKLIKAYICAGIFMAITLVRIAFPSLYSSFYSTIGAVLEINTRQTEAVLEYGENAISSIFKGKPIIAQPAFKCLAPEKRDAVIFAENMREREALAQSAGEQEREKAALSAAFVSSQKAVTAVAIPENVIVEVCSLEFDFSSPVDGIKSSGFGYRIHPISGELKFHYGTDFAANTGTCIKAFADGEIAAAGENDSYGRYIIINHGGGYMSLYAHCNELCVTSGNVKCGDIIATVGETGLATGPHLHFEIRYNNSFLNPEYYL